MLGFIVEGHMEADIIKSLCASAEVRRLQINGVAFPTAKICDRIKPQIQMLYRKQLRKIIIIIDREQREISAEQFEAAIRDGLQARGICCDDIIIACPDRNFETWIVPFVSKTCDLVDEHQNNAEGRNGKSMIRAIFKSNGTSYVEVVDGVKLFKSINPARLREISPSFKRFHDTFDIPCWWLDRSCS